MNKKNTQLRYRPLASSDTALWHSARGLNEMCSVGAYIVQLRHDYTNELLPLPPCGEGHYIDATLFVTESGSDDRLQRNRVIGQTLILPQCNDGKLHTFSRTNRTVASGNYWSAWSRVLSVTDLNATLATITEVSWDSSSCIDSFIAAGIYNISGERLNVNDGLPIDNSNPGHTIHARLVVLDSSITGTGDSQDKCITQVLTLSNRTGEDGNMYIRTGHGGNINSLSWEPWATLQTNVNVGQVTSLAQFIDNGIYSGVLADAGQVSTFVMIVINDYFVKVSPRRVSQFVYKLSKTGAVSYTTRVGTGDTDITWGDWENLNQRELDASVTELLKRIQGKSENSSAAKDPFKFIGNYDSFEALVEKLDTMHGSVGNTAKQFNGYFRAQVGSKLVNIFNEVQGYATDVWSQRITCAGIVLRNEVLRTKERYSQYSDDTTHEYRLHRYKQKFVNSISGGENFDIKGGVKTFCRRHYLTGDKVSTWTPWYDVENPYVQSQNYGKKIAIFGGSFAQNMAVESDDYQFEYKRTSYNLVDYIAEKLGAVAFDDYAVGGQGMRCDDDSPFPVHLMNQLKIAQSKSIYDVYIIMGGVNDYWCDKVPLGESTGYASGSSDDEEQNISYCGGLLKAIDYIRVNAPNAKIYTITPFKGYNAEWGWNPRTKSRNTYGNTFYEFIQAQKEVSQVKGVPCLDLWGMQGFSGANASEHYISDLLHPNGNGYYKVSEKFLEFIAHGIGNEVVDVQALMKSRISEAVEQGRQLALRSLFVAAGAEYNDGITDKTKTAPWGETVIHKAGHYYLNGLGDITEEQMINIYNAGHFEMKNGTTIDKYMLNSCIRTILPAHCVYSESYNIISFEKSFYGCTSIETICLAQFSSYFLLKCKSLRMAFHGLSLLRIIVQPMDISLVTNNKDVDSAFYNCSELRLVLLKNLSVSVSLSYCVNISLESILYMITNSTPTVLITITLHPDAYARLANDADVVAALEAQPFISLVSA